MHVLVSILFHIFRTGAEVRDHAEIINAVVRNSCESLLPMESIDTKSLRTLRDNLVVAEKFSLAIEISLKSGLELTGVMAAWGIACVKAGCFETGIPIFKCKQFPLISFLFGIFYESFRKYIMNIFST